MPNGKRGDDITIKFMGVEVTASGKTVVNVVLAMAVLSGFWLLYAFQVRESNERREEHDRFSYLILLSTDDRDKIRPYVKVPPSLQTAVNKLEQEKAERQHDETQRFKK